MWQIEQLVIHLISFRQQRLFIQTGPYLTKICTSQISKITTRAKFDAEYGAEAGARWWPWRHGLLDN